MFPDCRKCGGEKGKKRYGSKGTGEKDPEVYARIYREFPHNIKQILIRAVDGSNLHQKRFEEVFAGVPKDKWKVFAEASHSLIDLP